MRVRVLAFASAGEALGVSDIEIELRDGARIEDLRATLLAEHPRLATVWPRLAVAIGGTLVRGDAALFEGAEVALLPPVSGGAAARPVATRLTDEELEPADAVAAVSGPGRGAVVLFVGTVRDRHAGRGVAGIRYDAYRPMAEVRLAELARELEAEAPDVAVAIHHRCGELAVGDASVVIATASPHRAEAYEVNRRALERLKREVPIWKRERYADGTEAWREEEPLARPG